MGFREFIRPEFLVLTPVLYVVGKIIKNTQKVNDRHIPLILGLSGIIFCIIYIIGKSTFDGYQDIMTGSFTALVQGLLCAGLAVYGYEFFKNERLIKKKFVSESQDKSVK